MNRAIVFTMLTTFATIPLAAGCEKTGADTQQEANEARQRANREIGQANAQANEAQRLANEKIASAQAEFVALRDAYRNKVLEQLDALDQRITKLDVKAAGSPKAKVDLQSSLASIHDQRAQLSRDLRAIDATTPATFDVTKAQLDRELADLKAAIDKSSS
jgi:hypothetical protein